VIRNQGKRIQPRIVVTVRYVTVPDASLRYSRAIEILLTTAEEADKLLQVNASGLGEPLTSHTSTEDTVKKGNNNPERSFRRRE
jgi:hypothetical protein